MKVVLSCSPFEAIPAKVLDGITRAIKDAGNAWGVPLEVAPDLSCRDSEMRFATLMQLANERRETEGG